ncbi:MAG: hypothetical protein HWE20_06780 [Gammaproteobacteria bacterium]|nr:hypothetical protein [Gammaproteobacteria bacterium]
MEIKAILTAAVLAGAATANAGDTAPQHGFQLQAALPIAHLSPKTVTDIKDHISTEGVSITSRSELGQTTFFDFSFTTLGSPTFERDMNVDYQTFDIAIGKRIALNERVNLTAKVLTGHLSVSSDTENVKVTHAYHVGAGVGLEASINQRYGVVAELVSWDEDAYAATVGVYCKF